MDFKLVSDYQPQGDQPQAIEQMVRGLNEGAAHQVLLGVTGSGKTAVYLAAMKTVLDQGRSAILLVPEIGLTPAVAADVHDRFGGEVAILHSWLFEAIP